jgi:uncharacterized membrane protein YeaQ/YmgE (transglycosylase-associated protein family)
VDVVIALFAGAVIGWAARLLVRSDSEHGMPLNVVVGIAGAGFGSWIIGDLLQIGGARPPGELHVVGMLSGVLAACLLIVALRIARLLR